MFKIFLYQVALFFLNRLSLHSSYKLAVLLSDMQYLCSFKDRNAVKRNFKRIFPQKSAHAQETREVFRNFGRYMVEFFKANNFLDENFISSKIQFNGIDHLNSALKEGKGGIIVTAHIGNWEIGGIIMSLLGYPMSVVALPHKERAVNALFNRQRETKGVSVIPTTTAVRRCVEHLQDNRLVALVADRDFGANGFVMDFLGSPTLIPKGPAMFSWRTGAPIIPVFCIRNGDGTFTLTCKKPIFPPKRGQARKANEETLKCIIQQYLPIIEEQIKDHPSQWLIFRDFSLA